MRVEAVSAQVVLFHKAFDLQPVVGALVRDAGEGFGRRSVVRQLEQPTQQHRHVAEALAAARLDRGDDPVAEISIGATEVKLELDRRGHGPSFSWGEGSLEADR
jgi:hypothetical protein